MTHKDRNACIFIYLFREITFILLEKELFFVEQLSLQTLSNILFSLSLNIHIYILPRFLLVLMHRFRHLDTMVRLKTGGTGSRRGSSNGCSPDPSPSASPSRGRSPNGRA